MNTKNALPLPATLASRLESTGIAIARYGLVAILLLIGGLKFTHAEALGIQPLVAHSPFMSWMYAVASVDAVSRIIGTTEIVAALLIATRPFLPLASAAGSAMAVCAFLATLSFIITTPGVWDPAFPALSGTGSFLIKDLVLFGTSVLTAGEALAAARSR